MGQSVIILTATMTGTAELVADELAEFLQSKELDCAVNSMDTFSKEDLLKSRVLIICTSTTGTGDVPDNGSDFLSMLESEKPDLTGIQFGVCGLGDRSYQDTFNFGGAKFEKAFLSCGATMVGTRMAQDAGVDFEPEILAVEWCRNWVSAISE